MATTISGTNGVDKVVQTTMNAGVASTLNASGSAPMYACRAWVNFNGTGTVAINAAGNVSTITDNGTGQYTVNFISPMPDINYSLSGTCTATTATSTAPTFVILSAGGAGSIPDVKTVSAVKIGSIASNGVDSYDMSVVIFR